MSRNRRPVPTAGHGSRTAAVKAYDAEHPGAPAQAVAAALGCTTYAVWMCRWFLANRHRPRAPRGPVLTPAQRVQRTRDHRCAAGSCEGCGERPPAPGRKRCPECLQDEAARVADYRAERVTP